MRISTSSFYSSGSARMATLNARAETLNTQIASGKALTAADQAPGEWRRLSGLKQAAADDKAFLGNITLAQGLLAEADGAFDSMETQLGRARELAVQAGAGTLSPTAKEAIAAELDTIGDALRNLQATRDARGQPLFGGTQTVPVGADADAIVGVDGSRVFGGAEGTTDIYATLDALAAALRSGDDPGDAAGDALSGIEAVADQASAARSASGVRAMRLDLEAGRLAEVAITREEARSAVEDTDITAAITELQKTLTVLQATQASFSKLSELSLFNYLR